MSYRLSAPTVGVTAPAFAVFRQRWASRLVGASVAVVATAVGCGEHEFVASLPLNDSSPSPLLEEPPLRGAGGVGGQGGSNGSAEAPAVVSARPTLSVEGQTLRGRCGENIVLRGASEMVIWSAERDGLPWFDEMAKLGANSVRIVWLAEGTAEEMDRVLGNAVAAGLIPVIELQQSVFDGVELEATDANLVDQVLGYWTSPEILDVVLKYHEMIILEPAQDIGDLGSVEEWVARYIDIVERFRAAGYRGPLAMDAPYGGTNPDDLILGAPQVIAGDPLGNVIFTVEGWVGPIESLIDNYRRYHEAKIPFYIAEFSAFYNGGCPSDLQDVGPYLAELQGLNLGWFVWSWGGVKNSSCDASGAQDLTVSGHIDAFNDWGKIIAQTDPNSLAKTSVRLETLTAAECP